MLSFLHWTKKKMNPTCAGVTHSKRTRSSTLPLLLLTPLWDTCGCRDVAESRRSGAETTSNTNHQSRRLTLTENPLHKTRLWVVLSAWSEGGRKGRMRIWGKYHLQVGIKLLRFQVVFLSHWYIVSWPQQSRGTRGSLWGNLRSRESLCSIHTAKVSGAFAFWYDSSSINTF